MSIPTHPKGVDEAVKELTWGLAFKKHAFGSDSVDSRDLFLRKLDTSVSLHWGPVGKRATDASRTIALGDVTEVAWGKHTPTFEKKSASKADERKCVSITTKKRSLDCELDSEEHAVLIAAAVGGLLTRNGVKFTYKSKFQTTASAAAAAGGAGAKLERIDTQSDLSDAKSAPATAAAAASPGGSAAAAPAAATATAAAAPATAPVAVAAAAAADDPEEAMRQKFFSDVNASGTKNGIDYYVIVCKPLSGGGAATSGGEAKCYHNTSRQIGPRDFAHLDNAVRTTTLLLNLTETPPNPADVATKQRLATCKDEIEAVKKQLADTMTAIAALETPEPPAAAAAAGSAAAPADSKA